MGKGKARGNMGSVGRRKEEAVKMERIGQEEEAKANIGSVERKNGTAVKMGRVERAMEKVETLEV